LKQFNGFSQKSKEKKVGSGSERVTLSDQDLSPLTTRVSDPDPDSIRSVNPDPYSESGTGSRKAKKTHKSIIN
jgi:hypothetical protein